MALLGDFGTTWTKIYDTEKDEYSVQRTRDVDLFVDLATGHNANRRGVHTVNELIALAQGGLRCIGESNFILVDVGARDIKYVRFEEGRLIGMNWSTTCGALTGFTLELLGHYFDLNYEVIPPSENSISVTCGLLGTEQVFELVSQGLPLTEAVARFVRGIALNVHRFIGRPERFYLSGGMCLNKLFLKSFPPGVEVIALGRFVLIEGLMVEMERLNNATYAGASMRKEDLLLSEKGNR